MPFQSLNYYPLHHLIHSFTLQSYTTSTLTSTLVHRYRCNSIAHFPYCLDTVRCRTFPGSSFLSISVSWPSILPNFYYQFNFPSLPPPAVVPSTLDLPTTLYSSDLQRFLKKPSLTPHLYPPGHYDLPFSGHRMRLCAFSRHYHLTSSSAIYIHFPCFSHSKCLVNSQLPRPRYLQTYLSARPSTCYSRGIPSKMV